jgi:hypothetical protein
LENSLDAINATKVAALLLHGTANPECGWSSLAAALDVWSVLEIVLEIKSSRKHVVA